MAEFREVASGLQFPEGPIAMADGSVLVVEIRRGTLTRIAPDGSKTIVAETGGGPNGAAIGPDGRVYVCNNGGFEWHELAGVAVPSGPAADYAGGSVQAIDIDSGRVETLYTECDGVRLCGPNDLVFDSTGGFWFTDHGKSRPRERDITGVFYARADGSEIREVIFPMDGPNGIGLSADEDRLYVAETNPGRVWIFDIERPGVLAGSPNSPFERTLLAGLPGNQLLDSLAVDTAGNVCVGTLINGGVTVVSADGSSIEHIATDDPLTTNVCFGGPGLTTAYITCSGTGRLLATDWPRAGLQLAYSG